MFHDIDIANSKFVGYTYKRLVVRENMYSLTIKDEDALDIEIEEAAAKRREIRACKAVFEEFDVEDDKATVADILEVVTGKSIEELQKQTKGGVLAQDMMEKTGAAIKQTSQVMKKSTNSFANWLANKTK